MEDLQEIKNGDAKEIDDTREQGIHHNTDYTSHRLAQAPSRHHT